MWARPAAMLVTVLALGGVAQAQTPAASLSDVQGRLQPGESVIVTTVSGETLRGTLMDVTGVFLRLRNANGELQLTEPDIRRIERPKDTLLNGALIGAGVGISFGVVLSATSCSGSRAGPCFDDAGGILRAAGTFGLMGLGVGALVDAVIQRERVVFATDGELVVAPVLSRGGLGMRISMRW